MTTTKIHVQYLRARFIPTRASALQLCADILQIGSSKVLDYAYDTHTHTHTRTTAHQTARDNPTTTHTGASDNCSVFSLSCVRACQKDGSGADANGENCNNDMGMVDSTGQVACPTHCSPQARQQPQLAPVRTRPLLCVRVCLLTHAYEPAQCCTTKLFKS